MADQLPALPEAFARARHHIVFIGSVLLLNCDVVTVWFTMSGEGNVFESSTWTAKAGSAELCRTN